MAKKTAPKSRKTVTKIVRPKATNPDYLPLLISLLLVSIILFCIIIKQGFTPAPRPVLRNTPTVELRKTVTPAQKTIKQVVTPKTTK